MRLRVLMLALCPVVAFAQTNPAGAPSPTDAAKPNPAMAPVHSSTTAGHLPPVQPAPGVTQRVREANTHDVDAQGHTLDPHGKPVGQSPAPASSR
ncbi:hypothetical protein L2Y94_12260 [Luteibacter aegosomatis]|uniref:hypothetical protein n=1 Tax=Luteibacter aegosomatis TaxID=2911537 RepID=UPI001FF806D2|nr:hypothetical protein [Luteibacter aegosomatis]UPG84129.1 hypothetical protein L2Y94_12260 [Luteibacter aegosomatis]